MSSSSGDGAKGRGQESSCPNGLRSLLQNEMLDTDQEQRLGRQWLKLQVADHARLMQDNQRVLDTTLAADQALRQQQHRLREHQMSRLAEGSTPLRFPEHDMGDINIDSPENHYHYPPQSSGGLSPVMAAILGALLTAAAGAAGAGLAYLVNRPQAVAPRTERIENTEGFSLKLVPPEKQ